MISQHQHDDDFDERLRQRIERQSEAQERSQNVQHERATWLRPTKTYDFTTPQPPKRRRRAMR